jgi:thioredoxin 1
MLSTSPSAVYEAIAAEPGIVLLDFSAEWCAPCRAMDPVLDRLEAEEADLTMIRVDVEEVPELQRDFEVMSFPTLMFFVAGEMRQRLVGARGIGPLREELAQLRDYDDR